MVTYFTNDYIGKLSVIPFSYAFPNTTRSAVPQVNCFKSLFSPLNKRFRKELVPGSRKGTREFHYCIKSNSRRHSVPTAEAAAR